MPTGSSQSVPPFFIPKEDGPAGERVYEDLRQQTETRMGRAPNRRRISEVWTRRGNRDCITTVGAPDPISGGIVIAIFDMGAHQPFISYRQDPADPHQPTFDVLGNNAYTVSEFAA
jgi:hypothetical protein